MNNLGNRIATLALVTVSLQAGGTQPCVEGLCLGDGLDKLQTIKWKVDPPSPFRVLVHRVPARAKTPVDIAGRPIVPGEDAFVLHANGSSLRERIVIVGAQIDTLGLAVLRTVQAVCSNTAIILRGSFETDTKATINMEVRRIVEDGGKRQRFAISQIEKKYPGPLSKENRESLTKQFRETYPNAVSGLAGSLVAPSKEFSVNLWNEPYHDGAFLKLDRPPFFYQGSDRLGMSYPGCAAESVKL